MKKKLFACVMALIMALSLLPAAALAAETAEATPIEVVQIFYDEPVAGAPAPAVSVPADAPYSANEYYWIDAASGDAVSVLEDGKRYQLNLYVVAKDGYALSDETLLLANGEENGNYWFDDRWNGPEIQYVTFVSFLQPITLVEVLVDEPVAGAAAPVPTVPDGAPYAIDQIHWSDRATGEEVTALAEGGKYYLSVTLQPAEGYEFSDEVELTVNGSSEYDYIFHGGWNEIGFGEEYNFCQTVEEIRVDLAGVIAVGDPVCVPWISPEDPYEITSWAWYDSNTGEEATVFEEGHRYELQINFVPAAGYVFPAEGLPGYIAGEELFLWGSSDEVTLWYTVTFCHPIASVAISYDAPVVGGDLPEVKLPEDANYSIFSVSWQDTDSYEDVTTFEDGHNYRLVVSLVPDEGWEFAGEESILVTVNGQPSGDLWVSADGVDIYETFSFKEVIESVNLPAPPADLQPGDSLEVGLGSTDAHYSLDVVWQAMDDDFNDAAVGSVAEEGKNYLWLVTATPDEGYVFADDVTVTAGGQPISTALFAVDSETIQLGKLYLLGDLEMIEKVKMDLTMPQPGQEKGSLSAASGADFEVAAVEWAFSDDADDLGGAAAGAAEEGQYAWIAADLLVKDGYIFSPEVKYYINGQQVAAENLGVVFSMEGLALYTPNEVVLVANLGQVAGNKPVTITRQPQGVTVREGEKATVTVEAEGDGLKYAWYWAPANTKDYQLTNSFKGDTYSVTMTPERAGRQVYCIVTDKYGNTARSDIAVLRLDAAPVVLESQPADVTVKAGEKATVTVKASGVQLTYRWFYADAGSDRFTETLSFTGPTYSVTMNEARNGRRVVCLITDVLGNRVQTEPVTLSMPAKPVITVEPTYAYAKKGEMATISFEAEGEDLSYTWYYASAGSSSYKKTTTFTGPEYSVEMNDSRAGRKVYCVVTDRYGQSVKTKTCTLRMTPEITGDIADVTAASGKKAAVTVKADGQNLTYAWYYSDDGGENFKYTSSFKTATYSLTMNDARDGRQVYCVVTDKYGNEVRSSVATLTMVPPPRIVVEPTFTYAKKGEMATVSFEATGTGELTYEWYWAAAGSSKYKKTSTFTGPEYSVEMNDSRAGRKVYCVVTDESGASVRTKTVTVRMELEIADDIADVSVASGKKASVTVKANGQGLKYAWYYSDDGGETFKLTNSFKTATYGVTMNESRAGRQVYCVVTDKYGNTVQSAVATLAMK